MVERAVIFSHSGAGAPHDRALRERVLLGHPLIARSIIAAARAGVRDFLIVCDEGAERLAALLAGNRILARQNCVWKCRNAADLAGGLPGGHAGLSGSEGAAPGSPDFLLLSDTAVFKEEVLVRLLNAENAENIGNAGTPGVPARFLTTDAAEWKALLPVDERDPALSDGADEPQRAAATGFALCRGELFEQFLRAFMHSPQSELDLSFNVILDSNLTVPVFFGEGYAIDVRDASLYTSARRTLLNSVRKASDGFVSRHFNRYVSLFLSRIFITLGLSPNFISGANLVLALLAAVLLAWGEYTHTFIAALLFQLTSIIDGSDGEVAKLTWTMSPQGAWIDTLCDQLSYLMFFVALPIGLYNSPAEETYAFMIPALERETFLVLGGATLIAFVLMFLLMARYVRRVRGEGSMLQILKDIEASAREPGLNALLCRLVSKLAFIFRRDFFAFAAMIMLILNLAGALMWIVAGACWLMIFYLAYYSEHRFRRAS